jgi:hypothetical protein
MALSQENTASGASTENRAAVRHKCVALPKNFIDRSTTSGCTHQVLGRSPTLLGRSDDELRRRVANMRGAGLRTGRIGRIYGVGWSQNSGDINPQR